MKNIEDLTFDQIAARAIGLWANYIETGDPVMGAKDAVRVGITPRVLTEEQQRGFMQLFEAQKYFCGTRTK